jgi:hypothetical protein
MAEMRQNNKQKRSEREAEGNTIHGQLQQKNRRSMKRVDRNRGSQLHLQVRREREAGDAGTSDNGIRRTNRERLKRIKAAQMRNGNEQLKQPKRYGYFTPY